MVNHICIPERNPATSIGFTDYQIQFSNSFYGNIKFHDREISVIFLRHVHCEILLSLKEIVFDCACLPDDSMFGRTLVLPSGFTPFFFFVWRERESFNYQFNVFNSFRILQVMYFFSSHFWQFISSLEFVYFVYILKLIGITLFRAFFFFGYLLQQSLCMIGILSIFFLINIIRCFSKKSIFVFVDPLQSIFFFLSHYFLL